MSNDGAEVFWKDGEMRTPLSLEILATRELLRLGLPNVGPETIPRHLCEEFDKIKNIHGEHIFLFFLII